jgi:hypothetical protein
VTVLFADVVHSMDIAATVGAGRLREIMSELLDRSTAVVKRYGGTLSQFTGDGIMAVFGAPVSLEDHAVRACLAALGVQEEAKRLAVDVRERDGVELLLRVGLNSGQVIAGEIGQAHSVTPPSASRSVWPSGWSRSLSGDVLRCSGSRASVSSSLSGAHPGTDYITKLQRSVCGVGTDENGFH